MCLYILCIVGKKGKASPGGKGKAPPPAEAPPTEPAVAVETPEQLAERQGKCQLCKEHKAAIESEGTCMCVYTMT